mgnify:CR=1 FL=1
MTNDELKRYLEAVEYDIGAGLPGAETEYALGQEVLHLRAQLAQAQPLLDAAVMWMASNSNESRDASAKMKIAAAAYVRAQAASAAKG